MRLRHWMAAAALAVVLSGAKCPSLGKSGGKTTATAGAAAAAAAPKSAIPDSADQAIFGMRVVLNDKGIANGVLLSDTAYTFDSNNRLQLHRVNLTFFTSQGIEDGTLVAKAGVYNAALQRLEAWGDVIVNRKDGRRLTTPKLVYDQLRGQIFTDTTFTLVEPSKQVTGIGFESDPKLTLFKCLRACKGVAPVQIPAK